MRILSLVLTSSDIYLLEKCVNSVLEQQKDGLIFEYDTKIIVNTLTESYYERVKKKYETRDVEVIRTESNGYPGKGHNSCLQYFKETTYDYMTMIDGDDMYYPCAFQIFSNMLKKVPDIDLLHIQLNDKITIKQPTTLHSKLKYNFNLVSSFNSEYNWWYTIKINDPSKFKLEDTKTPSRILLVSKNIFKTTIPIEYSENLHLYDDMICFYSYYEAILKKEINGYTISNTNIYLYNALNYESASYNLKDFGRENKIFQEEMKKYQTVLKNGWKISEMPFITVEDLMTTVEKIEFCNKIVDFIIIVKKIQLSEANKTKDVGAVKHKHMMQFFVMCGLEDEQILKKLIFLDKENIVVWLIRLVDNTPSYENVNLTLRILLNKSAFNMCQYYYNMYKKYDNPDKQIETKYKILKDKTTSLKIKLDESKKTFCYYTGHNTVSFDGENYGSKNVYGSEIAAINLCEQLSEKYNSVVFCNNDKMITLHNNVYYISYEMMQVCLDHWNPDFFVISRFISCIIDYDLSRVKKILFIMHDTRPHSEWRTKQLSTYSLPLFKNFLCKIDKIVCVSKWQKKNFLGICKNLKTSIPEDKIIILNNGINTDNFNYNKVDKIKNRFVYISHPSRGLKLLCDTLIELQKRYKDITLDIYFDNLPKEFEHYIHTYDFIKYHGKITNVQIATELSKSDFWVYPNINSHETFCISCLEAQCGGNVIITRDYSALSELVDDGVNGFLIPGNYKYDDVKKYIIEKITYILDNNLKKKFQQASNKNSYKYDWKNISNQWIDFLDEC